MYNIPATRFRPPGWQPYALARRKSSRKSVWNMPTARWKPSARTKTGASRQARSLSLPFTAAKILTRGWCNPAGTKSISTIQNGRRAIVVNGPGGELRGLSCAAPPIREFEIHQPVSSRTITNGDVIFDLGQNAAHVPQISVTGPAGSSVRIIPSELRRRLASAGFAGRATPERHLVRLHQGDGRRGNVVAEIFLHRLPLFRGEIVSSQRRRPSCLP